MLSPPGSVVLVSGDGLLLKLVAAELREMGCRVFCARDLDEVADLVRDGRTTSFVLVRIGAGVASSDELRSAMAAQLPGWLIGGDEADDAAPVGWDRRRQRPN